jgi:hypothetical protein
MANPDTSPRGPGKAEHGASSEVRWKSGQGRQPYANQGAQEAPPPEGTEVAEGNRREHSGANIEQLEQVKKKP